MISLRYTVDDATKHKVEVLRDGEPIADLSHIISSVEVDANFTKERIAWLKISTLVEIGQMNSIES